MVAADALISVKQARALVPIGRSTLYALIASGRIPHYRVSVTGSGPGRILIARRDLAAFIDSARQAPTRASVRVDADAVLARVRRRGRST